MADAGSFTWSASRLGWTLSGSVAFLRFAFHFLSALASILQNSSHSPTTCDGFMEAQAQPAVTSLLALVMPTRDGVQKAVPLRRRRSCPGNAGIASSDASLTSCPTPGPRMGWRVMRGSRQLDPVCQLLLRSGKDSNKRSKEVSNCSTPVLQGAGGCDVGSGIARC